QRVAELEVGFFLEGDVGGGLRKGVLVGPLPRRAGAALHQFELLRLGEILRRPGDRHDASQIVRRQVVAGGGEVDAFGGRRIRKKQARECTENRSASTSSSR